MSVGHPHSRPSDLAHTRELARLLSQGDATVLMKRWNRFDFDHDIPYTCGYNVLGTTRYADRDFVRALYDPQYAEKILGAPIDTGLSPDDTLECGLRHESIEKVLLDADNAVDSYEGAHEFATAGEHELVRQKGGSPVKYERGLERIIKFCQEKPLRFVPKDYACAPALDDPDGADRVILARLKTLGIADASKTSKRTVHYGLARGSADHCNICSMWQMNRAHPLSTCTLVDGLVRHDRLCEKFEPMEGNRNG